MKKLFTLLIICMSLLTFNSCVVTEVETRPRTIYYYDNPYYRGPVYKHYGYPMNSNITIIIDGKKYYRKHHNNNHYPKRSRRR